MYVCGRGGSFVGMELSSVCVTPRQFASKQVRTMPVLTTSCGQMGVHQLQRQQTHERRDVCGRLLDLVKKKKGFQTQTTWNKDGELE